MTAQHLRDLLAQMPPATRIEFHRRFLRLIEPDGTIRRMSADGKILHKMTTATWKRPDGPSWWQRLLDRYD